MAEVGRFIANDIKSLANDLSSQSEEVSFSPSSEFESWPLSRYVISDLSGCLGGLGVGSCWLVSGLSVICSVLPLDQVRSGKKRGR